MTAAGVYPLSAVWRGLWWVPVMSTPSRLCSRSRSEFTGRRGEVALAGAALCVVWGGAQAPGVGLQGLPPATGLTAQGRASPLASPPPGDLFGCHYEGGGAGSKCSGCEVGGDLGCLTPYPCTVPRWPLTEPPPREGVGSGGQNLWACVQSSWWTVCCQDGSLCVPAKTNTSVPVSVGPGPERGCRLAA